MTPTKEQQAQEYADAKVKGNYGSESNFEWMHIKQAFEDGYTAAEQSQWRSVEEELPEETRLVLAAFKLDGYRTARMAIYSHDYERWISFPDHADDLAKHITEKLQKAYEKFRRGEPLD